MCLFNVIFSYEEFIFDSNDKTETYSVKNLILELKIEIPLKDYLMIKVFGKESEAVPHIIEYCKTDSSDTRIQLSHNPGDVNYIWLTKKQVEEGKYIKVTTPLDDKTYRLQLSTSDIIDMSRDSEYTYYASQYNTKMKFNFDITSFFEIKDDFNSLTSVTIWVTGEQINYVNIEGDKINEIIENGKYIYNVKPADNLAVEILAKEGQLISIGSRLFNKEKNFYALSLNNPKVYGYVTKSEEVKEACYSLSEKTISFAENDIIFLSFKIYNDIAEISFINTYFNQSDSEVIKNGYVNYRIPGSYSSDLFFCIKPPNKTTEEFEIDQVIYSLRISKNRKFSSLSYNPQKLGEFYPRILEKGSIASFIGLPPNSKKGKIIYNMVGILGFPDMYFDTCTNYPLCLYDEKSLNDVKDPHNVNSMSSYTVQYDDSITPISPKQNTLIVKCTKGISSSFKDKLDDSEIEIETCEFNTMIYSSQESIKLIENQMFNQYILKDETHQYTISFKQQKNLFKLYVDLVIFSGEVFFKTAENEEIMNKFKYQALNKIYYDIELDGLDIDSIDFKIIAKKNSFYSIQYSLVRYNQKESSYIHYIPTGANYLVVVDPFDKTHSYFSMKKALNFHNRRTTEGNPYLINFYSLNCEFMFYKNYYNDDNTQVTTEKLDHKDYNFAQDIIDQKDSRYNKQYYQYIVEIISMEQGTYDKKKCMLYTSSIELEKDEKIIERKILLSENVPQRAVFTNEYTIIKYSYIIPNINDNVGIRFILIDKANYEVEFYIYKNYISTITITNNQQYIIEPKDYNQYCLSDQPCPLNVVVNIQKYYISSSPNLEITIKSLGIDDKYPSYLIKDNINSDYLTANNRNYYFTDLGQYISGDIIINYYRGNGRIYGKIVKKVQPISDQNKEWRGVYDFPKSSEESLPYVNYLKKLVFTQKDTEDCELGCYLLLTVENKIENSSSNDLSKRFVLFDIIIKTNSEVIKSFAPIIPIPSENYIIGTISPKETEYESRTFYIFYIPYDSDVIVFDFQSEYATLYVNLYINEYYLYPTKNQNHWCFKSRGKPGIYEIKKAELLELAHDKGLIQKDVDSTEGLRLTIGVSAEKSDSIFTTIYSFKVHLAIIDSIDIIDVYSDQQALCNLTLFNDRSYLCLFVVRYDNSYSFDDLLVYPLFEDQSIDYNIYADFIDEEIYDLNQLGDLVDNIPSEISRYTTKGKREDVLMINLGNSKDKYVYISVETQKPGLLKLLTSFSTYDYTTSPNPSTPQLYIFKNEVLKFRFSSKDELMINLVGLQGSANVYWEDESSIKSKNKLGRNEKLSLNSPSIKDGTTKENILVINTHNQNDDKANIFYITYYLRSSLINFDQLISDNSFNFNYRQTDLPVNIYIKLNNIYRDTNVFVNFNTLESHTGKKHHEDEDELRIMGWVLKDETVFDVKLKKELSPSINTAIIGVYDPAKRVGLLSLKKEELEKYNIKEEDVPNLVIKVEKRSKSKMTYNRITMVGSVLQDDSLIPIIEKVYQYGKLKNGKNSIAYKLRIDKVQEYTTILFSCNSGILDFDVSLDKENKNKIELKKKSSNGRTIVSIQTEPTKYKYLYLIIRTKDNKPVEDDKLTNFAFKYINSYTSNQVEIYETLSMKMSYTNITNTHRFQIAGVRCQKCKVNYYVKFINRTNTIKGENYNNIAVTESKGIVRKFSNITLDADGNVILEAKDVKNDFAYVQIVAHVSDGSINEYLAYESQYFKTPEEKKTEKNEKNSYIIAFIIIGVIFIIVIIIFAIIIIKFFIKNKNLMEAVNKTSFQGDRLTGEDDDNKNDDLLLNK